MDTQILGISAALGSAASWAIGSILFEKIGTQLSPLAMTLTKGTISALILDLTLLLTGYETVDQQAL